MLYNPAKILSNHPSVTHSEKFAPEPSGELLSRGIRVNAVSPGPVQTPLYDKLGIPEQYRDQVNQEIVKDNSPRTLWHAS